MSIGYRLILSDGVRIKQEPHDDADPPGKISGRAAHAPWWKSPDICVSDEKAVLPGPDEEVVLPGPVGSTMRLPTSCFRCSLTFSRRDRGQFRPSATVSTKVRYYDSQCFGSGTGLRGLMDQDPD